MSLITYECQRAGHVHEIRQFGQIAQSLYDYFDGRDETALLIGNLNIGEANLDGLIIKNDAIIIVECKDYEGNIFARQNGDWTCDGKVIKGGNGGKSVFEQLRKNQRILRRTIAENAYFTEAQRSDIKGLVVFSKLTSYSDDFDRLNKSWVFVTDVNRCGDIMHDILSTDFRDNRTGNTIEVSISDNDIFAFLRSIKIDESSLVTDFTDTTIMPSDLFRKENTHNGKHYSTATLLARKTEEADSLRTQIEDLTNQLNTIKVEHQKEVNKKESLINQQKAEILQAMADKLESEKAFVKAQSKVEELSSLIGYNNQTCFFTTLKCLNVGCSLSSCSKAAASLTCETTHNVCRNILRYSVVENGKLFSASFVQRRFRNFSTSASCTKRPLAPTGIGIAFLSDFGLSALGFPVHVRKNSGKVNIPVWSSTLFIFLVMS